MAGSHQRLGWPEGFRFFLSRLEDGQRRGFVGGCLDHIGQRPLPGDSLDQFDDLALLGEAPGEFGVRILVVALRAHREQVGDLVLTPRGVVDAGPLAGFLGAGLQSTTVDEHGRQTGDDRYLRRRLLVLVILDPSIPNVLQFRAQPVTDPPHLPATDGDLGLIREGFRSAVEGTAARGGAAILPRIAGEKLCESSRKLGRRGKKIPATGWAMTDRFVVLEGPAAPLNRS